MPPLAPWIAGFPGAEIAIITLAFAWGATLGSFINVVVHRLPRGGSAVRGRSRCPRCGFPIRARDNVPVFGWLLLRGRCRDCGAAISSRYPLVEAACGGLTAAVAAAELVGGGRWLPLLTAGASRGIDRLLLHGDWRLLVSWGLHSAILLTILAWSLLGRECGSLSGRWAAVAICGAIAVVIAMPEVGPVGLVPDADPWPLLQPPMPTLAASLAGVAIGAVAGRITGGIADCSCLALLGAALGWQAVTVVTILTAVIRGVTAVVAAPPRTVPGLTARGIPAMVPAAAVQILCWQPILEVWRFAVRAVTAAWAAGFPPAA